MQNKKKRWEYVSCVVLDIVQCAIRSDKFDRQGMKEWQESIFQILGFSAYLRLRKYEASVNVASKSSQRMFSI